MRKKTITKKNQKEKVGWVGTKFRRKWSSSIEREKEPYREINIKRASTCNKEAGERGRKGI